MRILPVLLIPLLVSACSPRLIASADPTQIDPPVEAPVVVQTPDIVLDQILSLAINDLAKRLSLDPKSIQVLSAKPVLWPDSSLGCPRPGEIYTQETVLGYQIILEANKQEYIYHTDADQTFLLCVEEDLPYFPVTPGEIDDSEPWMPVD
ncbi:MAG TPA: hypothetical protein VK897_07835 [Anaerolineales bacterium]|nr:hypothetical protein [Anaerolineales bacterium]